MTCLAFKFSRLFFFLLSSAIILSACSNSDGSNTLPIANAGTDQAAKPGSSITLDGTDSLDIDGEINSQVWTQTGGTKVKLSTPNNLKTSFDAPQSSGTLTFELSVTDNAGDTSTNTVKVLIRGDVALFINDSYVDYVDANAGSEAFNLEQGIPAYGYAVNTFMGTTADKIINKTSITTQALVIPELEVGDLAAALDNDARTAIKDYVKNGGVLVTFGEAMTPQVNFLNAVFDWSLTAGSGNNNYSFKSGAAKGSSFEGAQAALTYNDGTGFLTLADLPSNAQVIYTDDATGDAVVTFIPVGDGYVVFIGYDWYDAAPFGTQDNGWLDILERALAITY